MRHIIEGISVLRELTWILIQDFSEKVIIRLIQDAIASLHPLRRAW